MKGKVKVLLGVLLCAAIGCVLFVGCNNKKDETVDIKEAKTITVASPEELLSAAQYVGIEYSHYTIQLTKDIDMSEKEWTPIGRTLAKGFYGTFDGNHKTISGLTVTGWDEYGTPKYIAKQIIGWLDNGDPVYKSTEVISVDKGDEVQEGVFAVNGIVKEGDDEDKNYQDLADGKGTFENSASYGSVGLFGYTCGAKIKDLTVANANLSFYTSGDFAYAGVISGYDVASDFENVHVQNATIALSNIYATDIAYDDTYGTPIRMRASSTVKEYVGGIVGYAKSNTKLENGHMTKKSTVLQSVVCDEFVFDNVNYSAYYDANITLDGDKDQARLIVDTTQEGYYDARRLIPENAIIINIANNDYPVQVYAGGLAGYLMGAQIENATVNGFNKATPVGDGTYNLNGATPVLSRSMYIGGAIGGAYSTNVDTIEVKDAFVNGVYWKSWYQEDGAGLVFDKATFGGAVGEAVGSTLKNGSVKGFYAEAVGENLVNVCIGGFLGYEDDQTKAENIEVDGMYAYSSYTGGDSEDLGSVLGGVVGVLRNSHLKDATAQNVVFDVKGQREEFYSNSRCVVAQAYGNASMDGAFTATNVRIADSRSTTFPTAFDKMVPTQVKNNIVNEDGYTSVRLYYSPNGVKYSDVYVTVYGELIPRDGSDNLLIREEIYQKEDLSQTYTEGQALPLGVYYWYDDKNDTYKLIGEETVESNKLFVSGRLYARKVAVYRVEFTGNNATKALQANTYYEYNAKTATFTLTKDTKANADKTYYVELKDEYVTAYYLDIKVYSESGNLIVVDEKDPDDDEDDVKAEARYSLTKKAVQDSVKTAVYGATEYVLAESEVYRDAYFDFVKDTGFKKDINGFVIKYYDKDVENRDFKKYIFVSGRPDIENATFTYTNE